MTNVHIVYYGFSALVAFLVYISARNMYKNWTANNTLMILLWASLFTFAILHWSQVSAHTDADTIAIYWFELQLRKVWAAIEVLKVNGLGGVVL